MRGFTLASSLPLTPFGRVFFAMEDLVDVMEQAFAIMVSNPLLAVLLAGSLLALGVRIFRKVKGAAK